MPIDPVKIPQNVYIEDHIVGPLTLRQIIISMLGIGFSYALYASISKVYGYVPLHITIIVWIPAAITLIFAFVRINDLSMTHILFLLVERMQKPQTRTWAPRRGVTVNKRSFVQAAAPLPQRRAPEKPLADLGDVLDRDMNEAQQEQEQEQEQEIYPEETSGSALPPRPVQPGRVTVNPLASMGLGDVSEDERRPILRDIHPTRHV